MMSVTRHWNRSLRVVDMPLLQVFKVRLDKGVGLVDL